MNNDRSLAARLRYETTLGTRANTLKRNADVAFSRDKGEYDAAKKCVELTWGNFGLKHAYLCSDLEASRLAWGDAPISRRGWPLWPRSPWEDEPFPGHEPIPRSKPFIPRLDGAPNVQTPGRDLARTPEQCRVMNCKTLCCTRVCEEHERVLTKTSKNCIDNAAVRLRCDEGRSFAYYAVYDESHPTAPGWSGIQFRPPCALGLDGPWHIRERKTRTDVNAGRLQCGGDGSSAF